MNLQIEGDPNTYEINPRKATVAAVGLSIVTTVGGWLGKSLLDEARFPERTAADATAPKDPGLASAIAPKVNSPIVDNNSELAPAGKVIANFPLQYSATEKQSSEEVISPSSNTAEVPQVPIDTMRSDSTLEVRSGFDSAVGAIVSILPSIDDVKASMNQYVKVTSDLAAESAGQVQLFFEAHAAETAPDRTIQLAEEPESLEAFSFSQPVGGQAVTEPLEELPSWVLEAASEMGITDLAGVKKMDEAGITYAYCSKDDCFPIRNLSQSVNERPVDDAVSGVVAPAVPVAPAIPEAPAIAAAPPVNAAPAAAAPVQTPPPQEEKKPTLEIVDGKVGPLKNGAVISVTLNGTSHRVVLQLSGNTIGTTIFYPAGQLGTLTRPRSSDMQVTLELPKGFAGTIEEVSPETLRQERVVAEQKAKEIRLQVVKSLIKEKSQALTEIEIGPQHLGYAKEAIELVLAQHKDDYVLFVKSVHRWCPPCRQFKPVLEKLAQNISTENPRVNGKAVVIVLANFDSFSDADGVLGQSTVPRAELIIPDGMTAVSDQNASKDASKVLDHQAVLFSGPRIPEEILNWAASLPLVGK